MAKYILIISFLVSFLLRLYLVLIGKQVGDVHLLYMAGLTSSQGLNPYLVYDYYVYPPPAIYLVRFCLFLTSFIPIPFHMILKFWPNLADFLSAILIYKYLIKTKVRPTQASLWTALFILNPISTITSASHGQLDPIFTLLVLLAVILINSQYLSSLLLGLAITIKPAPVLLIPLFAAFGKNRLQKRAKNLLLMIAPLAITLTPFLLQDPLKAINRIAKHSGIFDMGLSAVLRGIWFQINAGLDMPGVNDLLSVSKFMLLAVYLAAVLIFAGSQNITKTIVLTFLLFLSVNFGVSVQYLVWLIPFAILIKDKMVIPYIFFGTLAQLGFYLFLAQNILLGNLSTDAPLQVKNIYLYFWGNLLFWVFCLYWLIKIFKADVKTRLAKLLMWRKIGVWLCGVLLTVLLYLLGKSLIEIFSQFLTSV